MRGDPSKGSVKGPVVHDRIVDVVFGSVGPSRERQTIGLAFVAALLAHGTLGFMALRIEPSLESWSADMALRVHAELAREEIVELPPPKAPPEPPKEEPPEPEPPPTRIARHMPQPPTRESTPPPPAQAGNVLAQDPDPNAPIDLTGNTFVTGTATAYAGGVTTSHGTNPHAVHSRDIDSQAQPRPPPGPDHSRPVQLPSGQWRCPWPAEADDDQINEQTAVIRVIVRTDGRVESARVVQDPGHGFGRAAAACARAVHFSPARDRAGRPIRTQSPPIRVRFTR